MSRMVVRKRSPEAREVLARTACLTREDRHDDHAVKTLAVERCAWYYVLWRPEP